VKKEERKLIIQCRQCGQIKFDDALLCKGAVLWLRCSRCGHVYFQENPCEAGRKICHQNPAKPAAEPIMRKRADVSTESQPLVMSGCRRFHSLDKVMRQK